MTFRFRNFSVLRLDNFWRVSVSVLENLVSEKSVGFGKFGLKKNVSVSVSENFGPGKKSLGFGFAEFGL